MKKISCIIIFSFLILMMLSFPMYASVDSLSSISNESIEKIKEQEKAGSYPITIKITEPNSKETKEETVYILVKKENTVVNEAIDEAIDAVNATVDKYVSLMSNDEIIKATDAHAWNTTNGTAIPVKITAISQLGDNEYQITFATGMGTQTTAKIKEEFMFQSDQTNEKAAENQNRITHIFNVLSQKMLLIGFFFVTVFSWLWFYSSKYIFKTERTLYEKIKKERKH